MILSNDEDTPAESTREVSAEVTQGEADAVYIKMVVTNTAIVSWGSDIAVGGALFSNASTLSLVDTDLNLLSAVIDVGYDPYGIWGYAHLDDQITDVTFTGIPMILIDTLDGNQGLVSASSWTELLWLPPRHHHQ